MRDIKTILLRVQCDLPITEEEAKAANEHLDTCIREQEKFITVVSVVSISTLVIALLAMAARYAGLI